MLGGLYDDNVKPCDKWTGHNSIRKGVRMKILDVLLSLLTGMSPELREELKAAIDKMEAKAKQTKLPFDDVAVKLLRIATGL